MKGKLYLIPCGIGGENPEDFIPAGNLQVIHNISHYIVEDFKISRRFLKSLDRSINIDALQFDLLNRHTSGIELNSFLQPIQEGKNVGIISDAGCPGIADPGQELAAMAHSIGIDVIPLVGPSSILLALMASGMSGQKFTFHGYLPKERSERIKTVKQFESDANKKGVSNIFMDTPFRNNHVMEDIMDSCSPKTMVCVACNVNTSTEYIKTKSIEDWKKIQKLDLHKKPTLFIIGQSVTR